MSAGGWPRSRGLVSAHLPVLWLAVGRLSAAIGGPLPGRVGQLSSVLAALCILFFLNFIGVELTYNVLLVSDMPQSDSVIHIVLVQSLKLCMTLCGPMDCNMPAFPVPYNLPELAQTHVH